eukprot:TRINITY_DN2159_c0_g1_i1.p1 TRINITY_DN2159_c0_g1~~TRINITY_DN2159_c0_g1_i1.p1  ORF type:complete len:205 (+),score=25.73 TRINITY_DN2159_c0_g1_i1:104-718(+)
MRREAVLLNATKNKGRKQERIFQEHVISGPALDGLLCDLSRTFCLPDHILSSGGKGKRKQMALHIKDSFNEYFRVGLSSVTRVLQQQQRKKQDPVIQQEPNPDAATNSKVGSTAMKVTEGKGLNAAPQVKGDSEPERRSVRVVLVATDAHPRSLVSHVPLLAARLLIPVLSIAAKGFGSFQLGQAFGLRNVVALAIMVCPGITH